MSKFIVLLLFAILSASCVKPPVIWRYDPGVKTSEIPSRVALVKPVEDNREPVNENQTILSFIPLIIYETEEDQYFDQVLLENGSSFGSVQNSEYVFNVRNDLHRAIKQQLAYSGTYGPVFGDQMEIGQWSSATKPMDQYSIQVNEFTFQRKHLRYGLGPLAFIPHALGAPTYRLTIKTDILLEISDETDNEKQNRKIELKKGFNSGWYHQVEAEQRALNSFGIQLRETMEDFISEFN